MENSIVIAQTFISTVPLLIGFPGKLEKSVMHETNPLCW